MYLYSSWIISITLESCSNHLLPTRAHILRTSANKRERFDNWFAAQTFAPVRRTFATKCFRQFRQKIQHNVLYVKEKCSIEIMYVLYLLIASKLRKCKFHRSIPINYSSESKQCFVKRSHATQNKEMVSVDSKSHLSFVISYQFAVLIPSFLHNYA